MAGNESWGGVGVAQPRPGSPIGWRRGCTRKMSLVYHHRGEGTKCKYLAKEIFFYFTRVFLCYDKLLLPLCAFVHSFILLYVIFYLLPFLLKNAFATFVFQSV